MIIDRRRKTPAGLVAALLMIPALGCVTMGGARGVRLYPGDEEDLARVATLLGPIATVDGNDVSKKGTSFELRPGCHVVVNRSEFLDHDVALNNGAWQGRMPVWTFAFQMKSGYTYAVEQKVEATTGGMGRGVVTARAVDGAGNDKVVPPVTSIDEIARCRAGGDPGR
jgi:hypothetical protein